MEGRQRGKDLGRKTLTGRPVSWELVMKKILFMGVVLLILGSVSVKARAWVYVPDQGDTGWQTYLYTAGPAGFSGVAGFVVSNVIDDSAFPELLLDNLSHGGGAVNRGFEAGNYSNFSLVGASYGEVTSVPVMAISGNEYPAVAGENLSHQFGLSSGPSTAAFHNAHGQAGTVGSILETAVTLAPGEPFSFDWAFLGNDFSPWRDFSVFYLRGPDGVLVFTDGLGQIGSPPPVPNPSTLVLLGSGLLGLLGLGRQRRGR
jgi:hypothetical protein